MDKEMIDIELTIANDRENFKRGDGSYIIADDETWKYIQAHHPDYVLKSKDPESDSILISLARCPTRKGRWHTRQHPISGEISRSYMSEYDIRPKKEEVALIQRRNRANDR